ncbi:MAG TPA: phage head closure protein [Gemmataceae bacterium]|nr:phage head closure protein [Gemmataceae bacterium]
MLWKPLEAGELDKRVRLILPVKGTKTSFGELPTTPKVIAEVWASIEDISGGEAFFAGQASPEDTHLVKIRFLKGVSPKQWFLYGPGWKRVLEIKSVNDPMQRHEQLVIFCQEKVFPAA